MSAYLEGWKVKEHVCIWKDGKLLSGALVKLRRRTFAERQIHPTVTTLPSLIVKVLTHLPERAQGALVIVQKPSSIMGTSGRLSSGTQGLTWSPDDGWEIECLCFTPEVGSEKRMGVIKRSPSLPKG